jgi:1-deoxy-D-xylulose-5-phosphate synthase
MRLLSIPRYISGTDDSMLESLKKDHHLIVTLEDGSLDGGFGERIARFYGPSDMKVMTFGVRKQLYDRYDVEQLMRDNHLTNETNRKRYYEHNKIKK